MAGYATEDTELSVSMTDFATETTLAAQSAKLPASLGNKAASASLSTTPCAAGQVTVTNSNWATNQTGSWIEMSGLSRAGFQFVETGGPGTHVGTVDVQESDDGVNATTVSPLATTVSSGSAIDIKLAHPDCTSKYVRWNYTSSSGTGLVNVAVTVKP